MTAQPELLVRRVITADSFDGVPWPPNEPGLWTVARRLPRGFTLWRQIAQPATPPTDAQNFRSAAQP
jgi:hypothetical protein